MVPCVPVDAAKRRHWCQSRQCQRQVWVVSSKSKISIALLFAAFPLRIGGLWGILASDVTVALDAFKIVDQSWVGEESVLLIGRQERHDGMGLCCAFSFLEGQDHRGNGRD